MIMMMSISVGLGMTVVMSSRFDCSPYNLWRDLTHVRHVGANET